MTRAHATFLSLQSTLCKAFSLAAVFLLLSAVPLQAQRDTLRYGFDYQVLRTLQDQRTPGWNTANTIVTNSLVLAPAVPITQACAGWANHNDALLTNARQSAIALAACGVLTMGTKSIVRRPRPYIAYADSLHALHPVASYSFPSGHTSFTFCAATILTLQYPYWYVAVPAYLWAGAVAYSRLYLGVHYPTDVLAGIAVGVGSALLAHYLTTDTDQSSNPATKSTPKGLVIPITINF